MVAAFAPRAGALPEVSAMRDGCTYRRVTAFQSRPSARGRVEIQHFRSCHRDDLLQEVADGTHGLEWTQRLVTALLDELHVTDEFDRLVGPLSRVRSEEHTSELQSLRHLV